MPLQIDDLSALSYADGFTLWHYQSAADSRSTMSAPGYFAPVSHMVRTGDIILARGSDLRRWLFSHGSAIRIEAPEALRQEQQGQALEMLALAQRPSAS